jgi:hypothetical protein
MKHLIIAMALFLSSNIFAANPLIGNWISKKKTSENAILLQIQIQETTIICC